MWIPTQQAQKPGSREAPKNKDNSRAALRPRPGQFFPHGDGRLYWYEMLCMNVMYEKCNKN